LAQLAAPLSSASIAFLEAKADGINLRRTATSAKRPGSNCSTSGSTIQIAVDEPKRVVSGGRSWSERWMIIHEISSGNQGLAIKAQDADGQIAFVKVLSDKDQSNRERRGRVYREVSALRTINIAEIPKLLESNAEHHQDLSFQMYLATEFIEGPTLERHVEGSLVSPNLAVAFTVSLCETLEVAHKYGIYHRDVKPDNIIVSSRGANLVPVLVDFGMSSIKHIDEDFSTSKGQEIGNRFLRLPELSAGSENKSDPRSDVTFCVGLLFTC
jgi:serine/threonine-protein kinase